MLKEEGEIARSKRVKRVEEGLPRLQVEQQGNFATSVLSSTITGNPFISVQESWNSMMSKMVNAMEATLFNPLNEPSPLGLSLRKSPSLIELIQSKLTQGDQKVSCYSEVFIQDRLRNEDINCMVSSGVEKDKLKAANISASLLKIGSWECASHYEGDVVAKCYYAKRKLVWEVLDRGLKSKIEVQWSDITAFKAKCPENQPGSLDIEISRPPLFFKETNPQPRKHTNWQSTTDFTGGQATICRRHFLQFSEGVLNRHLEKLLQYDERLRALSEATSLIKDSLFFDPQNILFAQQEQLHYHSMMSHLDTADCVLFEHIEGDHLALRGHGCGAIDIIHSHHPEAAPMLGMLGSERSSKIQGCEAASPSSVIDSRGMDESSSSSDTEEIMSKNDDPGKMQLCTTTDVAPLNKKFDLLSRQSTDALFSLKANAGVCVNVQASDQQILNEIALHLLGEALTAAENQQTDAIPSVPAREMLQMQQLSPLALSPSPDVARSCSVPECCEDVCQHHEDQVEQFCAAFGLEDSYDGMLPGGQMTGSGSPGLNSHGSCVDLLYLPRIASLPQLFNAPSFRSCP